MILVATGKLDSNVETDACKTLEKYLPQLEDGRDYVEAQGWKGSMRRVHKRYAVECHLCGHPLIIDPDNRYGGSSYTPVV